MMDNMKTNLLKELEAIEMDINMITDFQRENPITTETIAKMASITKAKLGALTFKSREYITKFKTICNILEKELGVNLKNTLTKNQLEIYETRQEGSMVIVKDNQIMFDDSIPGIGEMLSKLN